MTFSKPSRPRQFFASVPVPCPYLASRVERKLVIELAGEDAPALFSELSRAGFRRSHGFAYRPACRDCVACVPVRIRVDDFVASRSLRRVLRRNADLTVTDLPPRATQEQYRLFSAYQRGRHANSEMATMTFEDFALMVQATPVRTSLAEIRDHDARLVGGILIDHTGDGLSAVYSFFDPDLAARSLGTFAVLWMVDRARSLGLPHVYLGYWIGGSDTMDYKRRFPALEGLRGGSWVPMPAEAERRDPAPIAAGQGSTSSLP